MSVWCDSYNAVYLQHSQHILQYTPLAMLLNVTDATASYN